MNQGFEPIAENDISGVNLETGDTPTGVPEEVSRDPKSHPGEDSGSRPEDLAGGVSGDLIGEDASPMTDKVIDFLKNYYCFYRQKYVVMSPRYTVTTPHYFTDRVLQSHLEGRYALAVFAGPKATGFISTDIDAGGKAAVRKVVDAYIELGIPEGYIYVSTSGKKGYHVDIFFEPYLFNEKAKNLYDLMIWRTGLDPRKVEFRPTQSQAVKLPLGIHAKTGNRCWYLDTGTLEPIKTMECISGFRKLDAQVVRDILREWNGRHWNEMYAEMICRGKDTQEYEINYDYDHRDEYWANHTLTESGVRHAMMIEIARDLRLCGAHSGQIRRALTGWYYRQDKRYINSGEREVLDDIDDIAEWAESRIPVVRRRDLPTEFKPITFEKEDINYILSAPTGTARRVALLIWSFCKMYKASHISYEGIAERVGCSVASAKNAVKVLCERHIICRFSGGIHFQNGRFTKKSNTYYMPARRTLGAPEGDDLAAETFEYRGELNAENFEQYYFSVLTGICSLEYLAKFLTKPELEKCAEIIKSTRKS